ncbi:MAG: MBL fold metallo-hydrolase [Minisyncoccia bacterium]
MKITFCGGARWVTGANYLLEHENTKILVDCGLFQGRQFADDLNYQNFKYDPSQIGYVFVTHSHTDHTGRLPKLFKDGFRGKVFCTTATRDLMAVNMPDSLERMVEEAKENGHDPLFSQADLDGMMSLVVGVGYDQELDLGSGIKAILHDAGHILGSAIIEIDWQSSGKAEKIFFSGDLGNPPTPLLKPTENITGADYLVIESAYGDRVHEDIADRKEKLMKIIEDTIGRKGVLMIPSFAMERTQELLFEFNELFNNNQIPKIPVFVDSPLAIKLTEVYEEHSEYFNKDATYLIKSGDDIFKFPCLTITPSVQESKAINDVPPPKIIIAGSGMSHGGRILHHELRYLPDPNSTILFVGYQVDGSLGRHIQQGNKEVSIFGSKVPVNCHIENISSYSAHADQKGLLKWTEAAAVGGKLKKVFVVQGEETAAKTLAYLIREKLDIDSLAPVTDENFELT